jgi:signal transduction histidine kinase/ActR/RegA family two-component response regulator
MKVEDESSVQAISRKPETCPIRVRSYVFVLGTIWTLVVSASLIWSVYQAKREILDVARHQARVACEKDALYRRWNSTYGGVYVPVTEKSPPNPYLEVPERDITTPHGVALTKVNPAYMTRQVHEMAAEAYGVRGHITSLNPIRPDNAPDLWETEALLAFQDGAEEISSVEDIQSQPYLRLMRPLFTENTCLSCHAAQGYQLGDIRGGISITLSMKPLWAMERSRILTVLMGHSLLWVLGLAGLGFGARRLADQVAERKHADESLKHNRHRLERINDCLLGLGTDYDSNMNRLTGLCGELLGAACALYNRLQGGMLCSIGQWQTPPDFKSKDTPAGHICYDLIRGNNGSAVLVTDLPRSPYWESDPNVRAYGLQTYFGQVVTCSGEPVGSLCVVFQTDYRPSDEDQRILGILACAIGNEDQRKQAEVERGRLEERLQRAEKMEALGTMAGGVAHDLNNVLGIVVGYSELLRHEISGSSSARSHVMQILKGGEKAAAIVQDLLTLTRRGVVSRQVLNLNEVVSDYLKSPEFAKIASYHPKVQIKTDLAADLLNISGSSVHIDKSLANLFINAAEAMPNGGSLTIKTRNKYLDKPICGYDEVKEGDYVFLSVSDTGEGIPPADLKRVFEPFYTKKIMGRSGTGIGLAIVWGTVKDHQGYINVESEEGLGSVFSIYLPVTRKEISAEEISVSFAEYIGKGESILVVDDIEEQRELATMMLKQLNYSVTSVSSGEEAVEYIKKQPVDLIVLDMIMDPGLDGLDTYIKILEIEPHQRAIIVSGFSETERVKKIQALGAGAYVKKPYVLETLGLAVRKELDQAA